MASRSAPVVLEPHDGVLVAVGLGQRRAGDPRRCPARRAVVEQFGERHRLLLQAVHVRIVGEEFGASERNTAVQLGSRPSTKPPRGRASRSTSMLRSSTFLAVFSCPVEIQVRPQQTFCPWHAHVPARRLQDLDRGAARCRGGSGW